MANTDTTTTVLGLGGGATMIVDGMNSWSLGWKVAVPKMLAGLFMCALGWFTNKGKI